MTSTAVKVAEPPTTRLHPETTALLAKWNGAKRICITTSEFSATQLTPFIADRVPSIELRSEFGELNERQVPASPAPVSNVKLVKWTFVMALLVGELFPDSELNYSVIVNDFPLPLDARADLHAVWPRYFPAPLIRIARDLGFAVDVGQDVVRLSHKNGQVRPLRLVFETSLRNAAKKGLARMARDGRVREASKKELEYSPDATRVKVRSTAVTAPPTAFST
jgi:hypothetical protein